MMRTTQTIALAIALLLPGAAGATTFELITATDPAAQFTTGTGVLTSLEAGGSEATVLPGTSLGSGSTLHLELEMSGPETQFVTGTPFSGTSDGVDDLWILSSGGDLLISAVVNSIAVSGYTAGAAGSALTSVTLGGLDPAASDLVLTGGSLADNFGGVGAKAELSILLNKPSIPFPTTLDLLLGGADLFDESFTAQMNVQLQFHAPEPGTLLLLTGPLAGLAAWRRRLRRA